MALGPASKTENWGPATTARAPKDHTARETIPVMASPSQHVAAARERGDLLDNGYRAVEYGRWLKALPEAKRILGNVQTAVVLSLQFSPDPEVALDHYLHTSGRDKMIADLAAEIDKASAGVRVPYVPARLEVDIPKVATVRFGSEL